MSNVCGSGLRCRVVPFYRVFSPERLAGLGCAGSTPKLLFKDQLRMVCVVGVFPLDLLTSVREFWRNARLFDK